jgi:acetaldehyde dehydrogenase (acetylating)
LTLRDRDLISIQEARELAARAAEAQKKFAMFSQEQVDAIVDACAEAATAAGEQLARMAVEETGYGNVPDKIMKNRLASVEVHRAIRGMQTVGLLKEDREKGIVEVATPVGVVAAIIPCTNPTSTAIYKTLISIKARNAVVLSPHPSAVRCICETSAVLSRAALKAGAPEGLIGCMLHTTMQGTQELMRHREVGVILATGGTGLVRAAYGSGKPAYGVGPGNVPAYIERTANVPKAVADIIAGKTFDYGTICSSEQSIVCDAPICDLVLEECRRQGAYFLSPEEAEKVGALVFRPGATAPNPLIVGKPATAIAEMAGIKVPPQARVLIARLTAVGREQPLSAEKLSPILAFYSVPDTAAAIELCNKLLHFGGAGHTAAVHTASESVAREFGKGVPAFRVCVNTAAVHGSVGYSTNLFPAMTLGCGALGGNITSDNVGPHHLMNVKRIAWESRPIEHRTIPADRRLLADGISASAPVVAVQAAIPSPTAPRLASAPPAAAAPAAAASGLAPGPQPITPDRQVVAKIVERVMTQFGIPRGGGSDVTPGFSPASASSAPAPNPLPSPKDVAAAAVSSLLGPRTTPGPPAAPATAAPDSPRSDSPALSSLTPGPRPLTPSIKLAEFVSETDVRNAIHRGEKIFIGPKTIITPSARDLASSHEVFIETTRP